ncbi:hypothetical protein C2S53_014544 [Perilla frutescens var. hirtella]|uniref:DDT domain-containing protein n=1 Tax=Perilla frutescens var. hirtella TaxID=608512 RepID=A0AAD4P9L1_PERFH|nr:hypothetical protein C2S53_014544 [Perilla frutescens var. hirtella]
MAVDSAKSPKKKDAKSQQVALLSSPPKRNNCPGIRLVGCRIYDSVNGKTCHQCRQKTRDFSAACKNQRNDKPCPIMYCHKCLLNRYGEKAEEVDALGEWSCPKCRGICNCSVCMKKRGHQPTGILINTAKATGFSSVSEMLLKGSEHLNCENVVAVMAALPKKEAATSPRKRGKENSFDGKVDANLPHDIDMKSKKVKEFRMGGKDDGTSISQSPHKRKLEQEAHAEMHDYNKKLGAEDTGSCGTKKSKQMKRVRSYELEDKNDDDEILKEKSVNDGEKKPKKSRKDELKNDTSKRGDITLARRTSPRKLVVSSKISNQEAKLNVGVDPNENMNYRITVTRKDPVNPLENDTIKEDEIITANAQVVLKQNNADLPPNIPLPLGTELNNVAGIDVSTEDVGDALQFLEFCAAFGKILEVKKGQPENILRDLFQGRTGRRGKFSVTVQFHIHLLSILQTEQGEECGELSPSVGKNSWFNALKKCFSQTQSILKAQALGCLEKASDYESLEASEKLKLLNVLCDEVLGTEKLRNWMDKQTTEHAEKVKEARQKVTAAKDKEKTLKQKMKDDVAKAIIARHGAPLSISEHEAIVSHIKNKAAEAHAKVLESKGILLENSRICNTVRIEPLLVGNGGNAYWKLNCSGNSNVLHQDVGKGDALTLNEKWFTIDDEGKEAIEKHICYLRGKRLRF